MVYFCNKENYMDIKIQVNNYINTVITNIQQKYKSKAVKLS